MRVTSSYLHVFNSFFPFHLLRIIPLVSFLTFYSHYSFTGYLQLSIVSFCPRLHFLNVLVFVYEVSQRAEIVGRRTTTASVSADGTTRCTGSRGRTC